MPILPGTDGIEKMSKSLDNYIGISEAPEEMYGKTLSISDDLIYTYFHLATDVPTADLPKIKEFADREPRNAKHELAWTIVRLYHGPEAADRARSHFEKTVIHGEIPEDVPEYRPSPDVGTIIGILSLMSQVGLTPSNAEGRRLIKQNAVWIDGERVGDPGFQIDLMISTPFVIKVGKRRFAKIIWNGS
jgi:tyrosyl-tRNA synthetase